LRRADQRLVGGEHDVGAEYGGKGGVGLGIGGLGEDDVEADRPGAGVAKRLHQLGVQAARPRPLPADLGEGRLVDGHDDRRPRRPRRRRGRRQIVEDPEVEQAQRRRPARQPDQQRDGGDEQRHLAQPDGGTPAIGVSRPRHLRTGVSASR